MSRLFHTELRGGHDYVGQCSAWVSLAIPGSLPNFVLFPEFDELREKESGFLFTRVVVDDARSGGDGGADGAVFISDDFASPRFNNGSPCEKG